MVKIKNVNEIMKIQGKELRTLLNYVLIKELDENPFKAKKTESGLILPENNTFNHNAEGEGRLETLEQIIKVGEIVDTGGEVKEVKVGDFVYYDVRSVRPVPISKDDGNLAEIVHTNEANIIAYVRE